MKSNRKFRVLGAAFMLFAGVVHAQNQPGDSRTAAPTKPLPPASSTGYGAKPAAAARGVSAPQYDAHLADPAPAEPDMHTL